MHNKKEPEWCLCLKQDNIIQPKTEGKTVQSTILTEERNIKGIPRGKKK